MYRYKLKLEDIHFRRSIRGIVLTKDHWTYFENKQNLKAFQDVVIEEQSNLNYPDGHIEMIEEIIIPQKKSKKKTIKFT